MIQDPTAPSANSAIVVVEIGGRRFRLRGSNEGRLRSLAARVDDAVRDVAGDEAPLDDPKVALLAALNIAGEDDDARRAWVEEIVEIRDALRQTADDLAEAKKALGNRDDEPTPV